MAKNYQPVIGLEIHIELATQSKMFCSCSASHFEVEPNTHCCPVCLGLPGALPVPNKKAVDWTIMLGLALNCEIAKESKFDRKNYFYPDLPKGYQISQYDQPLCTNGKMILDSGKEIGITRVHLEEDTGKLIHSQDATLIDFNRSGVPLLEVVTEPDFENSLQVDEFLKKLQLIVRYLEISSADMEKGSMRLEPNISVRKPDQKGLPKYKVEVKNINSFKFVRKAIEYEISRQQQMLEKGETPVQETRGWNESKSKTYSQRGKEEANDYRYFPEPDIPPMTFTKEEVKEIQSWITELPEARIKRFVAKYQLSEYNAQQLVENKDLAKYFEEVVMNAKNLSPTQIANWLINKKIDIDRINPKDLAKTIAESQQVFEIKEEDLKIAINQVLKENPKAVEDFRKGKAAVLGFLLGKVIAKTNPSIDKTKVSQTLFRILTKK
ncbi:Asp-tRNA(Asn)/Glu-tRNA(Gln) amidotransferase subunit GatB [Candidatus Parcubacteria bacterium]|nr:Asp-tRNA(Asn)/Glu-tRNA(Gln) amidotransferase subunit GatB [Patescibacteria group bacterium]MCG2688697.1 Asp-tRNA(Asn)/Glu-tRNA(Gln) amidotransferase subunit GatB [Candidatus Parcubacteria bacterium]